MRVLQRHGQPLDATPYRGHDGISRYLEETAATWAELRFETERILECKDEDVVVTVGLLRGEGRASGVLVEQSVGMVYKLRGRKIRYCRAYHEPSHALETAGLRE
jgi:ketosteroid isomerase-like protein